MQIMQQDMEVCVFSSMIFVHYLINKSLTLVFYIRTYQTRATL